MENRQRTHKASNGWRNFWGKEIDIDVPFPIQPKGRERFLSRFSEELAAMVKANLPIGPGLDMIAADIKNEKWKNGRFFKKVLPKLKNDLEEGRSLSESMARQPRIFPLLYRQMVAIGEKCGNLADALTELMKYRDYIERLRTSLAENIGYIFFVGGVYLANVMFLITVILPQFKRIMEEIAEDTEAVLPVITSVLFSFSDFVRANIFWILPGLILVYYLVIFIRSLSWTSEKISFFLLKIPFWGRLVRDIYLVRFARIQAMMLKSGVPLDMSFAQAGSALRSKAFSQAMDKMSRQVQEGIPPSQCLSSTGLFPSAAVWLVSLGENNGQLARAFEQIGDFYNLNLEHALNIIGAMSRPVVTLIAGFFIGALVIGMFGTLVTITEACMVF